MRNKNIIQCIAHQICITFNIYQKITNFKIIYCFIPQLKQDLQPIPSGICEHGRPQSY